MGYEVNLGKVTGNTEGTSKVMTGATANAAGTSGDVPAPAAGAQGKYLRGDGTWQVPPNTTYSNMGAATSAAAGKAGLVPAPAAGKQTSFLRGDGTWVVPTTYTHPTTSGNRHIPSGGSSGQILRWSADGTAVWGDESGGSSGSDVDMSIFTNATSSLGIGINSISSNLSTTAIGHNSKAPATYSTALGYCANALGIISVALGACTNASGANSIAIGYGAFANGNLSIAIGYYANAGSGSTVLGRNSKALGAYGTALGYMVTASGNNSTALGYMVTASGLNSVALGTSTNAQGKASIAVGWEARVLGDYSIALGYYANASGNYNTAIGYYASVPSTDTNTIQLGGTSVSALKCKVALTTTSDIRDKTDITEIDNKSLDFLNKIRAIRYVYNQRSDYIDRDNLTEEDQNNLNTYGICKYNKEEYEKGTKKGSRIRVGVSAQEVQQALIDVFGTASYANLVDDNLYDIEDKSTIPEDVESQLSVNYSGFIPFLIKAIQELSEEVEELSIQNKEQQKEINELKNILSNR